MSTTTAGMGTRVRFGTRTELEARGCLVGKVGTQPVCVFWNEGRARAVDDRCPHMGFPLHRGTVEAGLLTCHWHHARFDLSSGGTLDPFADDVRVYPVELEHEDVVVVVEPEPDRAAHHRRRLEEGLEQGLTLVIAKAVLGLLAAGVEPVEIVRVGVEFGTTYRGAGWGAGLTVLVAMANVLESLDPEDRTLALVQGLAFVSRDTTGRPPRFPLTPLATRDVPIDRLCDWYRRFVETRSADAAERTLLSAIATGPPEDVAAMMAAAATDHVFLDQGHTLDFTNKAFEATDHLGDATASVVLPTVVAQTAGARRHEEEGPWRHPHDLAAMIGDVEARLPSLLEAGGSGASRLADGDVAALAWRILADDPREVSDSLCDAITGGATPEQLSRAVALAAGLRITRFHTRNDHGDWDVVHHGFTTANALHRSLVRSPSPELVRGVFHLAFKVFLDRFLNVPAARLPTAESGDLDGLQVCWDAQGGVDEAGAIVYGYLRSGGDARRLVAALGGALLAEDAGFHWFQTYEAAVRQASAWPQGSEEAALVLVGAARFLAAHTPTRRELPQVVRTAARLRRGEALFEDE
ncbi:MAG TPA: Rieske (2Fe-2S) protein [Acidimicrobiales bacterium]